MARALDLGGLNVDFAFGKAELLVTTAVVQDVHRLVDPYGDEGSTPDVELSRNPGLEVVQRSYVDHRHDVTAATLANTEATSLSTNPASSLGNAASIS